MRGSAKSKSLQNEAEALDPFISEDSRWSSATADIPRHLLLPRKDNNKCDLGGPRKRIPPLLRRSHDRRFQTQTIAPNQIMHPPSAMQISEAFSKAL